MNDLSTTDQGDGVMLVEIHRPPANLVDVALLRRLADELHGLAEHPGCRAVVLATEGKHFCAGVDTSSAASDPTIVAADGADIYDAALHLLSQPLPLVAAVQGAAIGAGLGLALYADFRIATSRTRFAATWALLGTHPGFGVTEMLPRVVGPQRALEMLCSGQPVPGTEASRMGLCDRLVDDDDLLWSTAIEFARTLAVAAPLAARSIRETMRAGLLHEVQRAVERERAKQRRLMSTHDYAEGISAIREKRPPAFTGH